MLLFFLLYSRKDLRDRFVRLAARASSDRGASDRNRGLHRGPLPVAFFDDQSRLRHRHRNPGMAARTAERAAVGPGRIPVAVHSICRRDQLGGIAGAGRLCAVSRWSKALEILGAFVLIDQVAAQFAEPFIIGHGIDVSPVALLVSAMYWSWLWGIPGLLLSTPLTACLKVAGDFIPPLGFLSILLGADRVLDDYHDFYRMLLEINPDGARNVAIAYCDENGLERTFDEVIQPALVLMGEERAEDHISDENQRLIIDTTHQLIAELGNRFAKSLVSPSVRVLGVMAPGEVHFLGLLMLLELLRKEGVVATFAGEDKSQVDICELVKRFTPDFVFISCMTAECIPATLELVPALRSISARLTVIAGGPAAEEQSDELINAGCSQICSSTNEARRAVRNFMLQRAKSRLPLRSDVAAALWARVATRDRKSKVI